MPKVTKLIAPQPSTSSSRSNGSTLSKTKNYPSTSNKTSRQSAAKPLQRVASCDSYMIKNPSPTSISSQGNTNRTQIKDTTVNFRDFENKMLNNPGLNSTFQANNAALGKSKIALQMFKLTTTTSYKNSINFSIQMATKPLWTSRTYDCKERTNISGSNWTRWRLNWQLRSSRVCITKTSKKRNFKIRQISLRRNFQIWGKIWNLRCSMLL